MWVRREIMQSRSEETNNKTYYKYLSKSDDKRSGIKKIPILLILLRYRLQDEHKVTINESLLASKTN